MESFSMEDVRRADTMIANGRRTIPLGDLRVTLTPGRVSMAKRPGRPLTRHAIRDMFAVMALTADGGSEALSR